MKIQFIGATGTVTGSKYLLSQDKKYHLLDCGLFQGLKVLRLRNWSPLPIKPKDISSVILTHAHIDHSGYIPLLVKNGFRGKIYATPATKALCDILLPDAGHLQEEDAAYANKHKFSKHTPALPLYTEAEAIRSLDYFKTIPWGVRVPLSKNLSFTLNPAGHILGASLVKLLANNTSIVFSGDLGRPHHLMMNPPAVINKADYLVVESTYGNRTHSQEDSSKTLKNFILKVWERGGIVLIPTFAVGRAQELLHLINRLKKKNSIPDIPVFLNSPMAIKATEVYRDYVGDHKLTYEECTDMCTKTKFITSVEESKALNESKKPAIILSASGMATGGRVLHHLKNILPDSKNMVLFAGFQAAGTRGESLLKGNPAIKIHGQILPVKAEIQSLDNVSAHADSNEIMDWLAPIKKAPKMTFITHGEPMAGEALRKRIQDEKNWPCKTPDYLETCDVN